MATPLLRKKSPPWFLKWQHTYEKNHQAMACYVVMLTNGTNLLSLQSGALYAGNIRTRFVDTRASLELGLMDQATIKPVMSLTMLTVSHTKLP